MSLKLCYNNKSTISKTARLKRAVSIQRVMVGAQHPSKSWKETTKGIFAHYENATNFPQTFRASVFVMA